MTDEGEKDDVQELIHELYRAWTPSKGEKRSWAAFARHARLSEYSLAEWRSGRGAPNASNLLRLLETAGWLDAKGQQSRPVPDAPVAMMGEALTNQRQMQQDLEQLAADVAGLASDVRSALEALESRASTAESSERQERASGDG